MGSGVHAHAPRAHASFSRRPDIAACTHTHPAPHKPLRACTPHTPTSFLGHARGGQPVAGQPGGDNEGRAKRVHAARGRHGRGALCVPAGERGGGWGAGWVAGQGRWDGLTEIWLPHATRPGGRLQLCAAGRFFSTPAFAWPVAFSTAQTRKTALSEPHARFYAASVILALEALHSRHLVYRRACRPLACLELCLRLSRSVVTSATCQHRAAQLAHAPACLSAFSPACLFSCFPGTSSPRTCSSARTATSRCVSVRPRAALARLCARVAFARPSISL